MNSLIALPLQNEENGVFLLSVNIINSNFSRFSGCGSILSNQQDFSFVPSEPKVLTEWLDYSQQPYLYQQASNVYLLNRYMPRLSQDSYDDRKLTPITRYYMYMYKRYFTITGCLFEDMNYLKKSHLEGEPTRLPLQFARVSNERFRD